MSYLTLGLSRIERIVDTMGNVFLLSLPIISSIANYIPYIICNYPSFLKLILIDLQVDNSWQWRIQHELLSVCAYENVRIKRYILGNERMGGNDG